ncbi:MAG TPA: hypothetical protein VK808_05355 [Bacteroidia bacterium]|nr:hypothetical protein [Bacteroidia bacterium]
MKTLKTLFILAGLPFMVNAQMSSPEMGQAKLPKTSTQKVAANKLKLAAGKDTTVSDSTVLFSIAGGTNATSISNLTATGGLAAIINFSDKFNGFVSYNYGGNISKKQNLDSIPLASLIFPDIYSSAFMAKVNYKIPLNPIRNNGATQSLGISLGFAYQMINGSKTDSVKSDSTTKSTTKNYNFNALNSSIGVHYNWTSKSRSAMCIIGVYYNFIGILPEKSESFSQYYYNSATQSSPSKNIRGLSFSFDLILEKKIDIYFKCFNADVNSITTAQGKQVFAVGLKTLIPFKAL